MMKISMGYPTLEQEISIISSRQTSDPLEQVLPICTKEEIISAMETVREINIEPSVYRYIVELVAASRNHAAVQLGASPRASLALMRAAQSYAFLNNRAYVVPEDALRMTPYILPHRIRLTQDAKIQQCMLKTPIGIRICLPWFPIYWSFTKKTMLLMSIMTNCVL